MKFYQLSSNPVKKIGCIGRKETKEEMLIWTREEYLKFADSIMDKPTSFYAFEIFFWTGIRTGELLALTAQDVDFKKNILRINKSYQRLNGRDVITEPKTPKSNRVISMPEFLCEEMKDYINSLYGIKSTDRKFPISKYFLRHEIERGCKDAGIKRIRIHDLRHSHVSLLIDMGFSTLAIADRVGYSSIKVTEIYSHLMPNKQTEIANKLNIERGV